MSGSTPIFAVTNGSRSRDMRLIPVAIACWVGTLLGLGQDSPWLVIPPLGLTVLLLRRAGLLAVVVTVIAGALALFGASQTLGSYRSDPATRAAETGGQHTVVATITEPITAQATSWGDARVATTVRTEALAVDGEFVPSSVLLRATFDRAQAEVIEKGDRVWARGHLQAGFWAQAASAGELSVSRVAVLSKAPRPQQLANRIRSQMVRTAENQAASGGALTLGMSIGDRQLLEPQLLDNLRTASLTHLTAISGTHIGLVLLLISAVLPGGKLWRPLASTLFIAFLLAVVGPSPSVLRATAMAGLAIGAFLSSRSTQPQSLLSLVVLAGLFLDPWLSVSYGFALSVLATAGVIFSGLPWAKLWGQALSSLLPDLPAMQTGSQRVAQVAAISAAASLWVLPVSLLLTPYIPTWSVPANVFAAPAVAPVTILGLAAAATGLWLPRLADLLVRAATPFSAWIITVANVTAALPGAKTPWPAAPLGPALAALLVGLIVLAASPSARGSRLNQLKGSAHTWLRQLLDPR